MQTTPCLFGARHLAANGGEKRVELSAIEFFMASFGPCGGARRSEAIDSFAELTEVLLGVKAIDDLNRPGEQFLNQVPDPRGSISERSRTLSLGEAAALTLAPDALRKGGTFLGDIWDASTFDGCGIGNRPFIADGDALGIQRFCAPDRTEFD